MTENSDANTEIELARRQREARKGKTQMRMEQTRGEYGNYFRSWRSLEDWKKAYESGEYKGDVWLSQSKRPAGPVDIGVSPEEVESKYQNWIENGEDPAYITIAESPPKDWITLNAEIHRTPRGLEVVYSTDKIPHRFAMERETQTLTMTKAKLLLQRYMDPSSYDGIMELLDTHSEFSKEDPSHSKILEIHCFDRSVGNIPGRNTIIGEVRNY